MFTSKVEITNHATSVTSVTPISGATAIGGIGATATGGYGSCLFGRPNGSDGTGGPSDAGGTFQSSFAVACLESILHR